MERWNRLRNPIKNRATENYEFNLSVENIEIVPSQDIGYFKTNSELDVSLK
jgi:hypothetical protein